MARNSLLKLLGLEKPRFWGKYRGIVKDNGDPKNLLRIKALVPKVSKKLPLTWAFPCADLLGNKRGKFKVPAVGDGVWVEFEGGDFNYPIYSGMWCAKDDVPQDFIDNYGESYELDIDKNGNYIERSPNGIKIKSINDIILNDGDKGCARVDDEILSDSATDTAFWAMWQAFFSIVTGPPVTEPGNGAPSALQTAMAAAINGAGGVPSELNGIIDTGSDTVKVGD